MIASTGDFVEICRKLIAAGADINKTTDKGLSALHGAVGNENVDLCRLLLESGADPSLKDHRGFTPLDIAKRRNSEECIELLSNAENLQENAGIAPSS